MTNQQAYQPTECDKCGDLIPVVYVAPDGLSSMSAPHYCAGPSMRTIRRIIREEIEAAFKKHGHEPD